MKRWASAILLIVEMSLGSADLASAEDRVAQVTDRFNDDYVLQTTDKGHVVWKPLDLSDAEVFPDDGKTTTQHIDYSVDDYIPQLSDSGHVIWKRPGHDASDREILPATPPAKRLGCLLNCGR
jgi:hypothetical protein